MILSSTTIGHSHSENPFCAMENRRVFAGADVAKGISNFYGKVGSFGKSTVGVAGAIVKPVMLPLKILAFPFTAPTQIALWSLKKGYHYGISPITKAAKITAGTAMEMGIGLKEAVVDSGITLAKAPLWNLKMNLLDLPIHILKNAVKLPMEILRTPVRILSEIKKATFEFPKKVGKLIGNTRDNLGKVLGNIGGLKPIETAKSIAKTARDAVMGALVDPIVGTFQHSWAPMAPMLEIPVGGGKIIYESKKQYLTSMVKASQQFRQGISHMIEAPGKELDTHGIKKWWQEVSPEKKGEVAHAEAEGHAGAAGAAKPHAEPKVHKAETHAEPKAHKAEPKAEPKPHKAEAKHADDHHGDKPHH